MLNRMLAVLVLSTVAALSGCGTPSLNTLHASAADTVRDDRFLGDWVKKGTAKEEAAKATMHVAAATEKDSSDAAGGYMVTMPTDDGKTVTFVVHVVKLNDTFFVNAAAADDTRSQVGAKAMLTMMPVNQIGRLTISGEELSVGFLEDSAMKEHLKKNPKALTHAQTPKGDLLLTGNSKELQDFFKANAKNDALYSKADTYVHPQK